MNSRSGWFRGHAWDARARALFDEKIQRVSPGYLRARCFWLKATALFYGRPRAVKRRQDAIKLLERGLDEAGGDARDRAELLDNLGRFLLLVGDRTPGVAALRKCIELGGPHFIKTPDAETIVARRAREDGDVEGARALYDLSLPPDAQWGGKVSYGALSRKETFEERISNPIVSAEQFVRYCAALGRVNGSAIDVHDYDLISLVEIDRAFRFERDLVRPFAPLRHDHEYLESTLIPELGAYIGEVLCRNYGASWRPAERLMNFRVVSGAGVIDPFAISYDAVYYEASLEELVRVTLARR